MKDPKEIKSNISNQHKHIIDMCSDELEKALTPEKFHLMFSTDHEVYTKKNIDTFIKDVIKKGEEGEINSAKTQLSSLQRVLVDNGESIDTFYVRKKEEEEIEKGGKSMPVGTVSNGRKKVAEGKWIPISESKNTNKEEAKPKKKEGKGEDSAEVMNLKERFKRAKTAFNSAETKEQKSKAAQALDKYHSELVKLGIQKKSNSPFWKEN